MSDLEWDAELPPDITYPTPSNKEMHVKDARPNSQPHDVMLRTSVCVPELPLPPTQQKLPELQTSAKGTSSDIHDDVPEPPLRETKAGAGGLDDRPVVRSYGSTYSVLRCLGTPC